MEQRDVRANTKQSFIKTARRLFAEQGFKGTTMNAIAQSTGKSRRTLYTYFRTKQDIYMEVIRMELHNLYKELKAFVARPLSPIQKLMQYIARRQVAVNDVVRWNGSLEAEFFNDIAAVERARLRFDLLERDLIEQILKEGIESGEFKRLDIKRTALLLHACMKGLEVPFIRGHLGKTDEAVGETYRTVRSIISHGLCK